MKAPDEQDDLWQLLGKARKPAVSPLFARNVLREIRQSQHDKPGMLHWLQLRWRLVSLCGLAAVLLAVNAAQLCVNHKTAVTALATPTAQPAIAAIKPDETEVISHLDELVAYEENSIWLEDSSK